MSDVTPASDPGKDTEAAWITLSLQDGLAAESVYQTDWNLDRINSTFWQRCRATFQRNRFRSATVLDICDDAWRSLFVPVDANDSLRQRFLRALRVGLCDAIGYHMPRDPTALPVLIPAHVWESGEVDWNKAELTGAGFAFTRVRILMAVPIFELHSLHYVPEPLHALAPFTPSEEKRKLLGLPVESSSQAQPNPDTDSASKDDRQKPGGRPSYSDAVRGACRVIERGSYRSNKEYYHAIRAHIMRENGITSEAGLGDDAIRKLVKLIREETEYQPPKP